MKCNAIRQNNLPHAFTSQTQIPLATLQPCSFPSCQVSGANTIQYSTMYSTMKYTTWPDGPSATLLFSEVPGARRRVSLRTSGVRCYERRLCSGRTNTPHPARPWPSRLVAHGPPAPHAPSPPRGQPAHPSSIHNDTTNLAGRSSDKRRAAQARADRAGSSSAKSRENLRSRQSRITVV